jgi:hypothetical protein
MTTCTLSGTMTSLSGQPLAGALVAIRRDDPGNVVPFVQGSAVSRHEISTKTDDHGQFSVTLARGAKVVIRIPDLGLHIQTQVPDSPTVTLEEIVNASL